MIAPGDQCRARRRAERRGMEIGITQSVVRDAIHRRCRYDATEGARCAETDVVRHDEQYIGRAFRRHDARRPPGRRIRGFLLDHSAIRRIRRRKLFSVDSAGRAGRTGRPGGLLCGCQTRRYLASESAVSAIRRAPAVSRFLIVPLLLNDTYRSSIAVSSFRLRTISIRTWSICPTINRI